MKKCSNGMSVLVRFILAWFLVITLNYSASAQLPTATIYGAVKDSSGAVIPGVAVTVTNSETGQNRTAQTGNDGMYRFPALNVGTYNLRAEHPGFQASVQQGLRVSVGDEAVLNFTLEVGAVTETVSVTAEAPIVNTTSGTLGSLVNSETITDLPLDGRNWNDLTLLQVGVNQLRQSDTSGTLNGTQFSANGAPVRSNLFTIDGTIMNDAHGTGGASGNENTLGVEAIREYKVATNAFSAEYGMSMGSQISLVTKSGTNHFHGSLFEYLRNNKLDARDWDDLDPITRKGVKPPFRRNNFGGAIGGPIRPDKAFFFFTYEGLRQSRGETRTASVPIDEARVDGAYIQGAPLNVPNGQIAASVKPYLALFPRANNLDDTELLKNGIGRYFYTLRPQQKDHYVQGRVDYTVSGSDSMFGRYSIQDSSDHRDALLQEISSDYPTRNQYLTLSDNHIFSPALLGTFRGSFSRTHATAIYHSTLPTELAFLRGQPVGAISVTGLVNPTNVSGTTSLPVDLNQRIFSYSGDMFYTLSKHSLKFGLLTNLYRQLLYNDGGNSPRGSFSFRSLSDFLRAIPNEFSSKTPGSITDRTFEYKTWGFYLQDDFRLFPTVTLNLGLRYEFQTQVAEIRGKGAALRDLINDGQVTTKDPVFINPSMKNFSPRVGFAWDVFGTGRTSVRGGGALLYDIGAYGTSLFIHASGTPPLSSITTIADNNPFGIPVPAFGPYPFERTTVPAELAGRALRTIDYKLQQPRLLSYNLTVEQQLPLQIGLTAAYAGSRGMHLMQNQEGNPIYAGGTQGPNGTCLDVKPNEPDVDVTGPKCWLGPTLGPRRNPRWEAIDMRLAEGDSWYNSLQLTFQKQLAKGLQFQSSYTWAHSLDDSQGQLGVEGGNNAGDVTNRRYDMSSSNFDLRHSWTFNSIYRLPSRFTGALGTLTNGWQFSSIVTWRSGDPMNLSGNSANRRRGAGSSRPDLQPGIELADVTREKSIGCTLSGNTGALNGTGALATLTVIPAGTPLGTKEMFYDPCAFAIPALGYLGNLGRNTLYGPNFRNFNFSVIKDTPLHILGESGALQFRAEFFNVLNMVSWNNPSATVFSPIASDNNLNTFFVDRCSCVAPRIGNTVPGRIESTSSRPREIQLALKILF